MNKTIELESGIVIEVPENIEEFKYEYLGQNEIARKITENLKTEIEEEMDKADYLSYSNLDSDAMTLFIARMILKHRKYTIELPGIISGEIKISSEFVE